MNRRRFLAASLRLPAAFAALPVLGGLATLAQEGEPEVADLAPAAALSEPVVWGNVITNSVGTIALPRGYWSAAVSGTDQVSISIVGNTVR